MEIPSKPVIRVLLVDDLPEVRNIVRRLLEASSADVEFEIVGECGDGSVGAVLYRELRPDVVLTNVLMPGLSGLDMAERILTADASAKILFLTASSLHGALPRAVEMGARGWIRKPPSAEQLVSALVQIAGQPEEREKFLFPARLGETYWVRIGDIGPWLAPYQVNDRQDRFWEETIVLYGEALELVPGSHEPKSTDIVEVLVVDDIADVRRRLIGYILRDPKLRVVGEAADGQEAVELFRRLKPDVVSMNICMPRMDGVAATKLICSSPGGARVVIVSVQAETDYIQRAFGAGAMRFLAKPVSRDDYVRVLKEASQEAPRRPSMA